MKVPVLRCYCPEHGDGATITLRWASGLDGLTWSRTYSIPCVLSVKNLKVGGICGSCGGPSYVQAEPVA